MPRPILLFTGPFADVPLESLAAQVAAWGYHGVELCCWGDHCDVRDESSTAFDVLERRDLMLPVLANHKVGQATCDRIDERHQSLLPERVWGDGSPVRVQQRAIEEMKATFRAAERLGAQVVSGFTGSPIWNAACGYPGPKPNQVSEAMASFAETWHPLLDVARDCGVRFAFEVHPGQLGFDLFSTELMLDAIDGREEFGLTFDPSHLLWQGVDPVEFLRRFGDRIYHVHVKDATLTLNGRTGVLSGYWPSGDPRRGFQFRSPGRGSVDWDAILRTLNEIGYEGPLSVDWHDAGLQRDFGAAEACEFLKRLDFDPPPRAPQVHRPH